MAASLCWYEFGTKWPLVLLLGNADGGDELSGRIVSMLPETHPEVIQFMLGKSPASRRLQRILKGYTDSGDMLFCEDLSLRDMAQCGLPVAVPVGSKAAGEQQQPHDATATVGQLQKPWLWDVTPVIRNETGDAGWVMKHDASTDSFDLSSWTAQRRYQPHAQPGVTEEVAAAEPAAADTSAAASESDDGAGSADGLDVVEVDPSVEIYLPDDCRAFVLDHRYFMVENPTFREAVQAVWRRSDDDGVRVPMIQFPSTRTQFICMGDAAVARPGWLLKMIEHDAT